MIGSSIALAKISWGSNLGRAEFPWNSQLFRIAIANNDSTRDQFSAGVVFRRIDKARTVMLLDDGVAIFIRKERIERIGTLTKNIDLLPILRVDLKWMWIRRPRIDLDYASD